MEKKKDMVWLGVRVSAATHADLKKLADEGEVSMSAAVRKILKEYFANSQKSA